MESIAKKSGLEDDILFSDLRKMAILFLNGGNMAGGTDLEEWGQGRQCHTLDFESVKFDVSVGCRHTDMITRHVDVWV